MSNPAAAPQVSRTKVDDRPQRRLGWMVGVCLLSLLAACVTTAQKPQEAQAPSPERVYSAGLKDMQQVYIDEIEFARLTEAGVVELAEIDPAVSLERSPGQVQLFFDGKSAGFFPLPKEQDSNEWGKLTAEMVEALKRQSASLGTSDNEKIYEVVFDGMIRELDSFSRYASAEEARENRASRNGFGGIGVRIDVGDTGIKVVSVMHDTPAELAGLLEGDLVVSIDGETAIGLDQREVIRRLRGPVDSIVMLGVLRNQDGAEQQLDVPVTRAHIVPETVRWELNGDVAVIQLSSFNQSTARTLKASIEEIERALGPKLRGIVLDLRGNPGGLLDQSVAVSDLFLDHGRIVTTHGRHPESHQYFEADSTMVAEGVPIVVLINGHSASASEIVAAALQDSGRALVIGSTSYGKGTVQTVLRLPNEGELTLTWARFLAPSGYPLHERGILPDLCTSGTDTLESVLRRVRRGELPFAIELKQSVVDDRDETAVAAFKANCPTAEGDNAVDLELALSLLADYELYARVRGGQAAAAAQGLTE